MEKIWLKSYPQGVPAEINPDAYQSIVEVLDQSSTQFSELPAFYNMGTTLTYKEVDIYSKAFASYLVQVLKLKKGDRIAIMLPNVLQYPIAMFGALRAGLIVVNVNPLYTVPELAYQLKNSGAEAILVLSNFASVVEQAIPGTAIKHVIVTDIGDMLPRAKAAFINFVLKYIRKKIPAWSIPQAVSFKKVITTGKQLTHQPVAISNDDIAFLQYTGGTTGVSKAAMLTHRNIISNIEQADAWFKAILTPGTEIIVTALPLYHIFSLTANCLYFTKAGGLNVLITNPRDTKSMIADMGKFKFTAFTGVNTLFNSLLKHPNFAKLDFSGLKLSLGGGMAVQRIVAEKWQQVTGMPLLEAYGLTETSPCVSMNPVTLKVYNGTVGLPVSSTDIKILNDEGNEVPLIHPGELAIKGPQVMRGYWQNERETEKVFTNDGWLLTGDVASVDEQGFLRIIERKKDMILVSGFNVYPNEIEDALVTIPGIVEAAVVGVPDENSGEAVKALLVKDDPNLTAEIVHNLCKKILTGYKIPKYIEFRKELPKSNVGKILRRALRDGKNNERSNALS